MSLVILEESIKWISYIGGICYSGLVILEESVIVEYKILF